MSALEDRVHRRAFEGVEEPIVHQGQFSYQWEPAFDADGAPINNDDGSLKMVRVVNADGWPKLATIRKYSDSLAMFMLKVHAPDKYRENSKVELSGSIDLQRLTDAELEEELEKLAALEAAGALSRSGGGAGDDADDLV